MGIFSSIKRAIFGEDAESRETAEAPPAATARPGAAAPRSVPPKAPPPTGTPTSHSVRVSQVDVENSLDSMPGADRLNWRTSIVDLMKLLNIDSDYESRKALAQELGREDYSGSAEDNMWLHKRVMNELAANGGKVPADLRD